MDIEKKFEDFGKAFEEFKKANDKALAEAKKFGEESAASKEKLAKIEAEMQKSEKQIEEMKTAFARSQQANQEQENVEEKEQKQYSEEFKKFMRKGVESAELKELQKKFLSTDDDANGGLFVSGQTSSSIEKKIFESTPLREMASVQTISGPYLEILQDNDEVSGGGWVGEVQERPETNTPKVGAIKIYAYEMYEQPAATQTMLDDAAVNVEQWLADKVSSNFGRREATAFVKGDGASKPKGILAYGSDWVERVTAAGAAAIVGDDLIKLQDSLLEDLQGNAQWLMHRSVRSVIRKLKSSDNQYLWVPGLSLQAQDTLLGKPIKLSADMEAAPTTGKDTIIYGDFKAGYQIVDRIGIRVLRDMYTKKPFVLFYTTKRTGGGVKNKQALKVLRQA